MIEFCHFKATVYSPLALIISQCCISIFRFSSSSLFPSSGRGDTVLFMHLCWWIPHCFSLLATVTILQSILLHCISSSDFQLFWSTRAGLRGNFALYILLGPVKLCFPTGCKVFHSNQQCTGALVPHTFTNTLFSILIF